MSLPVFEETAAEAMARFREGYGAWGGIGELA